MIDDDETENNQNTGTDDDNSSILSSSSGYSSSSDEDGGELGYVPGFLDDPQFVQGRYRNVMVGDSATGESNGVSISNQSFLLFFLQYGSAHIHDHDTLVFPNCHVLVSIPI